MLMASKPKTPTLFCFCTTWTRDGLDVKHPGFRVLVLKWLGFGVNPKPQRCGLENLPRGLCVCKQPKAKVAKR